MAFHLSHFGMAPTRATVTGFGRQNRARDETSDKVICQKEDHNDAEAE
jgi:hypothetical protein